ncbi:MAG: redox-regulated ATPase YchF [Candidatus Woesearchaeota archaeon]
MLIGIVGKPSCGKSTFFKAATLAEVDIANYPFTTIKPNHAVGFVRVDCVDTFFKVQCNPRTGFCMKGKRFVPVDLIDVAGLVPGAHKGEGMGKEFLNDLNQADALIHVVDVSGSVNEKGEPVEPLSYDPVNDVRFLEEELDFWYLDILKKPWERFAKQIQMEHKEPIRAIAKQFSGLGADENMIKELVRKSGLFEKQLASWTDEDLMSFASALRRATKPMIIAANKVDIPGAKDNFERLKKEFPDYIIVPCSAEAELALKEASKHEFIDYVPGSSSFEPKKEMSEKQLAALNFLKTSILEPFGSTGVQKVLETVTFDVLKFFPVFPGGMNKLADQYGNILPDCFLMKPGTTALDFAYKLHTDFGKNFVKAMDVRKRMPVGKDHVLNYGDVIEIMSSK